MRNGAVIHAFSAKSQEKSNWSPWLNHNILFIEVFKITNIMHHLSLQILNIMVWPCPDCTAIGCPICNHRLHIWHCNRACQMKDLNYGSVFLASAEQQCIWLGIEDVLVCQMATVLITLCSNWKSLDSHVRVTLVWLLHRKDFFPPHQICIFLKPRPT